LHNIQEESKEEDINNDSVEYL